MCSNEIAHLVRKWECSIPTHTKSKQHQVYSMLCRLHTASSSYILNSEPKRIIREITQQNVEVPELYAEISKNC